VSESNPYIPPSDDQELIHWLEERRLKARRRLPEYQMKLNLAFLLGQQWVAWNTQRRTFERPTTRSDDPNAPIRLTINKMAGIAERTAAALTKENAQPECRPASDDDSDVSAAKVGTRILSHEMSRLRWSDFITDFIFWPITLGWSYIHVAWDPKAGDSIIEDKTGVLNTGEIAVTCVPASELVTDPFGMTMRDKMWAMWSTTMPKEAVWEKWGKIPDAAGESKSIVDEIYALAEGDTRTNPRKDRTDSVEVHQYWLRPGSRGAPNGLVITWCGNTVLEKKEKFPYDHGQLPFVQCNLLPGIGTSEGRTWFSDLIPMQTDYNDARSREAMLRRTMTPKLLAPVGSIDTARLTSRVEVIPYAPTGGVPSWEIPSNSWMSQHEQGMQRSDAEMGERSGQNDATKGNTPASMPAAAILALQEADATKMAISSKQLSAAIAETGWHILNLVKQYWTEERLVRTWSEEGDLEAHRFSGADVKNVLDVHVSAESTVPRSKAARTQMAMELQAQGFFPDPRLFLRTLDMPGIEFLAEHLNLDAKQSQRENTRLREGIICEVHDYDNHTIHVTEHNNFRKTQEYEILPMEIRAVFDAHVATHNELILQQSGVPTPPGTPTLDPNQMPPAAGTPAAAQAQGGPHGSSPAGGTPMYVNPTTGVPNNPLDVASGRAPSALTGTAVARRAGIGGAGQPGAVPGHSRDAQAASMGR
jgi:hypothetical protein